MPTRRQLLQALHALPAAALLAGTAARAQDAMLKETDPEAMAVDYHADAARVDRAKSPAYRPGQTCANCSLYGGNAGDATGGCGYFFGKQVAAIGWCTAWDKKA